MENPVTLHEDTFYEYFKPYLPAGAENDIWGGHGLETYGSDFDLVRRTDPNFVWTIVDGESDTQWIIPGIYYVNRVCYLVTAKPHYDLLVEFRVEQKDHSLTALGLKRQLRKLERLLADHSTGNIDS